jgi:hypothetical protein
MKLTISAAVIACVLISGATHAEDTPDCIQAKSNYQASCTTIVNNAQRNICIAMLATVTAICVVSDNNNNNNNNNNSNTDPNAPSDPNNN